MKDSTSSTTTFTSDPGMHCSCSTVMSESEQKSKTAILIQDQNRAAFLKIIGTRYHVYCDGVVVNSLTQFIHSNESDHLDL